MSGDVDTIGRLSFNSAVKNLTEWCGEDAWGSKWLFSVPYENGIDDAVDNYLDRRRRLRELDSQTLFLDPVEWAARVYLQGNS